MATVLVGVLSLLSACALARTGGPGPPGDDHAIGDLVWADDGWIYYTMMGSTQERDELWRTKLTGDPEREAVAVPECPGLRLDAAFRVEGRLALAAGCTDAPSMILVRDSSGGFAVMARTPYIITDVASGSLTGPWWIDDLGSCSVKRLAEGSFTALRPAVGATGLTFTPVVANASQLCDQGTEVGWPAAGRNAVAVVRHDWGKRTGHDTRYGPATIYVGADLDHPLRPVGTPFEEVQQTAWVESGDGALVMCAMRHLEPHLWTVDVATGRRTEIGLCRHGVFAISPDGRSAVVVAGERNGRPALDTLATLLG